MFKSTRAIILVLGALLVGITLFAGFVLVTPGDRNHAFWYSFLGLITAEVMLSFNFMDIGGHHEDRALPYRIGNLVISATYLLFTAFAFFLYGGDATETTILLTQIIGLFVALTMHILFGLAATATAAQADKFKAERTKKREFKIEIESAKIDLLPLVSGNRVIQKHLSLLSDMVKFSPESVCGIETLDQEIQEKIQCLHHVIADKNEDKIDITIQELIGMFQKRNIRVKELR